MKRCTKERKHVVMAVYTKLRRQLITYLYADATCYVDRELVQVWTKLENRTEISKRFLSDLAADRGLPEILDIVKANTRDAKTDHQAQIAFFG
jgi:hypothetical protein